MQYTPANINWNTPAGRELDRLVRLLPAVSPRELVVFGSAPLQLLIGADFLSADVDVIGDAELAELVSQHGLGPGQSVPAIHVCDPLMFQTTADWSSRAVRVLRHGHTLIVPHPWDILVSKLPRLEPKYLEAYRLVTKSPAIPRKPSWKNSCDERWICSGPPLTKNEAEMRPQMPAPCGRSCLDMIWTFAAG